MKLKGAIYDMDGTLLDSMEYWETAGIEYLKRNGIEVSKEVENNILNIGILEFSKICNDSYGMNVTYNEVLDDIHSIMEEKYTTVVELKTGAKEMLERFKQGGVKMCVATATEQKTAKMILKKLGILEYFEDVITTTMVGKNKNFPLIYEKALELLGTEKDETYVFEDALYAIKTAKKHDFKVVGIEDKYAALPTNEIAKLCDYFLYTKDNYNTPFFD
jgi:HAD superfamily hydrolase (TIGR01509 family)